MLTGGGSKLEKLQRAAALIRNSGAYPGLVFMKSTDKRMKSSVLSGTDQVRRNILGSRLANV
jgi:hypothetical protein